MIITPTLGGYRVTTPFRAIDKLHPSGHKGLDLAMPVGTEIHSVDGGKVLFSGYDEKLGNYVKIHGNDNTDVIYGHLSECKVHTGDYVIEGQEIGLSGNTGHSTGPHLHLQTSQDGELIDPTQYAVKINGGVAHESFVDHIHNVSDFIKNTRQEGLFYGITGKHFKEWFVDGIEQTLYDIIDVADILIIVSMVLGIGTMAGSSFCKKWLYYSVILYVILKLLGGYMI